MHTYSVREDSNYGFVLNKDGKECFCPFQQPVPTQGTMGVTTLMRLPCSTNCPNANIIGGDNGFYEITCGEKVSFALTKVKEEEEKIVTFE